MSERLTHLAEVTFPARDEDLCPLIRRLSEPTNAPRGDNFFSNEDSYPRVVGTLERDAPRGGVYLGVGPDQNFTYLAAVNPRLAFILDYRRRNLLVQLLHKALCSLARDRSAYLTGLTARVPAALPRDPTGAELVRAFEAAEFDPNRLREVIEAVQAVLRPLGILEEEWSELATIQARMAGPGMNARFLALPIYPTLGRMIATTDSAGNPAHYISTEARYQRVRELQMTDRVVPLVADLAGDGTIRRLGRWLEDRRLAVSVFYVSDVEFFLLRSRRFDAYLANLEQVPWAPKALIVRTSTRELKHPGRDNRDRSTTIVERVDDFLGRARSGRIRTPDDLFA